MHERVAASGEPFQSFFMADDLKRDVAALGFSSVEDFDAAALNPRYFADRNDDLRLRGSGHLMRYAKGIRPGVHVRQGQLVAYVGSTGMSTGEHLPYEIRMKGDRVNPVSARVPQGTVLAGADLKAFMAQRARIDRKVHGDDADDTASEVASADEVALRR